MNHEWRREGFVLSTDPTRLNLDAVHGFLTSCYWSSGITRKRVERSVRHSICFGLYEGERLVGFQRVITDRATFAYLADVFVLEPWRGRGLARWMVECALAHPDLAGVRGWLLATRDAHDLYRRCGYAPLASPERWMQRRGEGFDGSAGSLVAAAPASEGGRP